MRRPREIGFRLKQEARNVSLLAFPPRFDADIASPLSSLPAPESIAQELRSTEFAEEVVEIADQIVAHRFPLLGFTIETGRAIDWRHDYVNHISSDLKYFRLVPYLDVARVGDHKNIWELNRHQQLVPLAQAYLFTNRNLYLKSICEQLESWWEQNPYQRGINWTSALEVAFRALSWIWLYHFAGSKMPPDLRSRFLDSLYQHGCHIENNLSFYFSPNTHLLGEAVALHALGQLFPAFPRSPSWVELGGRTVREQMGRQVRPDGAHFEQSTYYHVYALDMFLFHAVLSHTSQRYKDSLARMADFLHTLMGPERSLPFLGDDDGGRWFHPYGPRDQFGRATLATCATLLGRNDWTFDTCDLFPQAAWWLGRTKGSSAEAAYTSETFPDTGLVVLQSCYGRVIFDCGPFGPGRAGHSHSDSLSVVVSANGDAILTDSGTYTYVASEHWRNAFRGSSAHNTIRVDRRDQATAVGPFRWSNPPKVMLLAWESNEAEDKAVGECKYAGITHRRAVHLIKPKFVFILDYVEGPFGEHEIEQFWHVASAQARDRLFLGSLAEESEAWHSPFFGQKYMTPCLIVRRMTTLPASFAAAIILEGAGAFSVAEQPESAVFEWSEGNNRQTFRFAWPNRD